MSLFWQNAFFSISEPYKLPTLNIEIIHSEHNIQLRFSSLNINYLGWIISDIKKRRMEYLLIILTQREVIINNFSSFVKTAIMVINSCTITRITLEVFINKLLWLETNNSIFFSDFMFQISHPIFQQIETKTIIRHVSFFLLVSQAPIIWSSIERSLFSNDLENSSNLLSNTKIISLFEVGVGV